MLYNLVWIQIVAVQIYPCLAADQTQDELVPDPGQMFPWERNQNAAGGMERLEEQIAQLTEENRLLRAYATQMARNLISFQTRLAVPDFKTVDKDKFGEKRSLPVLSPAPVGQPSFLGGKARKEPMRIGTTTTTTTSPRLTVLLRSGVASPRRWFLKREIPKHKQMIPYPRLG